jgi:hypothetical protein
MKKHPKLCTIIFIIVACFISHTAIGNEENQQNAFYAIASLRFHLHQLMTPQNSDFKENAILFENSDIAHLWSSAKKCSVSDSLESAEKQYYEGLEINFSIQSSAELLCGVKQQLDDVWEYLNRDLLNTNCTEIENKSFSFNYINKNENGHHQKLHTILHALFSSPGAIENEDCFRRLGFSILHARPSGMIVASHPSLSGYLLKLYFHSSNKLPAIIWEKFTNRCKGADNISRLIKARQLKHFSVPDKWIYTPPSDQSAFILVVTDMNIVPTSETKYIWKNKITREQLKELYCIISHGYASSCLRKNIPYTKNGKFACIDTEYPQRTPLYEHVKKHLSNKMKLYWDRLVKTGGHLD